MKEYYPPLRNITRAALDVVKAARWYHINDKYVQYSENLDIYDEAAQVLTDRQGYAQFLTDILGLNSGKTLEIAAGTGLVSQELKPCLPELHISDLSRPALQKAQTRTESGTSVTQADFFHLPYGNDSFNTIVCIGGYRYVTNDKKNFFWAEAGRILRPDGRFLIGQFYPRGSSIVGSNIKKDLAIINNHFYLANCQEYVTTLQGLSIRSGKYLTYEFRLHD